MRYDEPLLLGCFGKGRALDRARVDDCRSARRPQNLVAMNVTAKHDSYVSRQVGRADHIGPEAKGEVPWAASRSLDALMDAQHFHVGRGDLASRGGEYFRKATTDLVRVWKSNECGAYTACLEHDASWPIEDMQALVRRQQRIRYAGPLVISRKQQDWHSGRRDAFEWRQCRFGKPGRHATSIQQVASVYDHIDLPIERGLKRPLKILKEVLAPPAPDHTRTGGQIQTKMRVGHEQYSHGTPVESADARIVH